MLYEIDNTMSINSILPKLKSGDTLYLMDGIYYEKIEVKIDNINIVGQSKENTIISNNDYFCKIMDDYNECNTFRTYTCYINGNNITMKNLTIRNDSIPSAIYGQAVALYVDGDNFKCENCILKSAQDTLFTGPLPPDLIIRYQGFLKPSQLKGNKTHQLYKNVDIYGDVDFIFGGAYALFYRCNIISVNYDSKDYGYLSAPSHSKDDKYGYLFYQCNLIKQPGVVNVYLSRPWRDYGNCAFIDCSMDDHISPKGWNKWEKSNRDKTAKFYEYTENVDLSKRENWVHILNKDEKEKFKEEFFKLVNFDEN
ncbi:MAG: hypothetical protein IKP77_07345 [Acholeplasmatales bacterium]|nr:hypothetical protein [Acholeplasmatales bacterium]